VISLATVDADFHFLYINAGNKWVIPCQVNQIFSTFEPDPLGFFSHLAHHMYPRR